MIPGRYLALLDSVYVTPFILANRKSEILVFVVNGISFVLDVFTLSAQVSACR